MHHAQRSIALAQVFWGGTSGLVQLAIVAVVLIAIWMLVDHFVTDATIKLVVKVIGGAVLLIFAIRILAGFAGL